MRIISGTHKGRKIIPPNNLRLRPTTDKAKEALLNIVHNRYFFKNKNMLDLFSGSGNIALEFASRGVKDIIAIDNNIDCIDFIRDTAKSFQLNINPLLHDSLEYVKNCKQKFNFIFLDPPYNYKNYYEIKDLIIKKKLVKKDGLLIIEHSKEIKFDDPKVELRNYGTVHFSLFSF